MAASVRKPASAGGRTRSISVYSSPRATTPSTTSPRANTSPPCQTRTIATGAAISATSTRAARSDPPSRRAATALPGPEPPPALGVLLQGRLEHLAGEVRPELVAEHELGVGELPEQVVRD